MKNESEKIIIEKTRRISLAEINPYIRRASKHFIEGGMDTGIRLNIHYQLHYIFKGKGTFIIGTKHFEVGEDDFLIWCPGEEHRIVSNKEDPLQVIGIQFDFTRRFHQDNYPCVHYNHLNFSWNKINELIQIKEIETIPSYTKVLEPKSIKEYLEDIVRLYELNGTYAQYIMSGLLKATLIRIFEDESGYDTKFKIKKEVVMELIDYIHKHYREKLTNVFLGNRFGYHPNHLNQMVLKQTNYTIQQYIIHIRMNKAIDLIANTNHSISEIGNLVGGYSVHYFSRLFKKKTGLKPSDFRKTPF